jgi:hypothetical protein
MSEQRLDDAVAALGRARPRLDDLTRARVAARLEAELARADQTAALAPGRPHARPVIIAALGGAVAAAVVIVIALAVVGGDDGERAAVAAGGGGAAAAAGGGEGPAAAAAVIDVAAGAARRIEVGGAAITVFGPGHFDGRADRAATDAAALVVDRPAGDTPWSLRHGDVEIVATRATFAVDRGTTVRVMVMRGELTLRCDADVRQVRAGESASCTVAGTAPPAPAAVTAPAPDADAAPVEAPPAGPSTARRPAVAPARPAPSPLAVDADGAALATPVPAAPVPAAPSTPPPVDEPLPEPVPSSAVPDLYALAEGAMRRGDHAGARAALQAVVAAGPGSLDAALALLDLARLAHADGDAAAARGYLDRLDRHPRRAAIAGPAARLRAQITGP